MPEEKPPQEPAIIPSHQWTNGGKEVLILKCVPNDGVTRGQREPRFHTTHGFSFELQWPLTIGATVEATDWDESMQCGGGLHGWPWGLSMGDGKDPDWQGKWIVFGSAPADIVTLGGKCKAKQGTIRFVGSWWEATTFVLAGQMAWVHQAARGAASATGESGAASATGESGAASATGESGAASATGARGAASATGWSGAASATGESGAASATGIESCAKAGPFGCIALAWWNKKHNRQEMRCARIGKGDGKDKLLKSDTWYVLNSRGQFVIKKEGN